MSDEQVKTEEALRFKVLRSWTSLAGLILAAGSVFSFLFLFAIDFVQPNKNPYVGILAYLIAPAGFFFGIALMLFGMYLQRRRARKTGGAAKPVLMFDLSKKRDRRNLVVALGAAVIVLLFSAFGTYHSYHYTESQAFCGEACHTVMKPEMVTYSHGPHARVACVECHIGPGATWYVKSKLSGTYQLYAVAFNKFPRPIETPIKNLRPAQETCEHCHWPSKFVGNLDRTYNYFLGDETNSPYTVRLTMKVGGADPTRGPVSGIHWHMNVGNKVEYIATDKTRQKIPWVRITDAQGVVTEFRTKNFTNKVEQSAIRTMDCMDCHNRPAHAYETPNDAVNMQLALGKIDSSLPYIKTNAIFALTRSYTNETEAVQSIATILADRYSELRADTRVKEAIGVVQRIYTNNFFPEMKASWRVYPDNIGHKDWPGCFRCHDGEHKTADGKQTIKANDCNACHTILAQGSGVDLDQLTPNGQKFKHPGDEVDGLCNDCHTGE